MWTSHAVAKMRQYGLSEQRVRRVLRAPKRKEEAIVPGLVAVMQLANPTAKRKTEIWVMYQVVFPRQTNNNDERKKLFAKVHGKKSRARIISAWRFPGETKPGNPPPIPEEILKDIHQLL